MPFTWGLLWCVLCSFNSQVPVREPKWRFVSIANYGFTIVTSNLNFHITQTEPNFSGVENLNHVIFWDTLDFDKNSGKNHNNVTGPIAPDFQLHWAS